jgi:hypothetical protein
LARGVHRKKEAPHGLLMMQQMGRAGVELPRPRICPVIRTSVTQIEEDPPRVRKDLFKGNVPRDNQGESLIQIVALQKRTPAAEIGSIQG